MASEKKPAEQALPITGSINGFPDVATGERLEAPAEKQDSKSGSPWRSNLTYFLVGVFFGIILVKSEVVSWFRIQEMFRLQSFHMYGVIGTGVLVGAISVWLMKKFKVKALGGEAIEYPEKQFDKGKLYGGLLFGLGWAMTGACPGPIFALIGSGFAVMIVVFLSALAGTWFYGLIRDKLPH